MKLISKPSLIAALAVTSSGCGLIHQVREDSKPPVKVPENYQRGNKQAVKAEAWWKAFEEEALDKLMDEAFAQNLDVKLAYSRLDQVMAGADGAFAGYFPSINGSGDARRSRNLLRFSDQEPPRVLVQDTFTLGLSASYELDLWGRVHSTAKAGALDAAASAQDLKSATMSLSAQVGDTWFQILEQQALLELLEEQLKANETYLELVQLRFGQGQSTALDVLQQKQQVAATRSQIPPVQTRLKVLQHQMALLLGKPAGEYIAPKQSLPDLPSLPATGVPADLLGQRPDVQAAWLRMQSSDYRVGAALAARLPAIRLSADISTRGFNDVSDLFTNWMGNLIAGLTAPIFDGGRLGAEHDRAKAKLEEQLTNYGKVVLTALKEVEDALVQEQQQELLLKELSAQEDAAEATFKEAQRRYLNGLNDYLPVLNALRSWQSVQQRVVSAKRQRISFRVQLCRALGGTWMEQVSRPALLSEKEG